MSAEMSHTKSSSTPVLAPGSKRGGLKLGWDESAATTPGIKKKVEKPDAMYRVNTLSSLAGGESDSGDDAHGLNLKPSTSSNAARKNNKVRSNFYEKQLSTYRILDTCRD